MFILNVVPFILPIEQRRFRLVEHSVSLEVFVISVNYNKTFFEHKINEFVRDIIKEAQNSDSYRYHWAVHGPLCEGIENPPDFFPFYFFHSVIITLTVL